MIRQLTRSIGDSLFENLGRAAGRVQERKPLPADVLESEDAYLVVFDAPGVTATDVQVRYVDDRVEVRLDRFRDFYDEFEMVYPGRGLSLDGSATLPDDAVVDAAEATATLRDDGTLRVRIPKGWGAPGPGGEDAEDRMDDTVEEADERENAGTPVADEESSGEEEELDADAEDDDEAADGDGEDVEAADAEEEFDQDHDDEGP